MKKLIYVLMLLAIHSQAQDSLRKVNSIHYGVDFGYGVRLIDNVANVNNELATNGYPTIAKRLGGFEFGLMIKRKRFGVGFFERKYWGIGNASNQKEFLPSSFGADLRFIYGLLKGSRYSIEPLVGLGYQSFNFKLLDKQSQSLSQTLQNPPQNSLRLKYGGTLFCSGINLSARIKSYQRNYRQLNAFIGLQAIYNFQFGIWTVNDQLVDSKDQLSGWQIKLTTSVESSISKRR